ncbi:HK97 family phage prohead protease [Mesorhizobium sp. INR15]|uniref:HK97 family phage prohead protease n=1 Tax=Mesorhizobium sp. INR15 TaxID=2654248 RepID=UPI001896717B|nr:HK97 family phage prohead protease [Mesorhizobium sp. INR15]QPC90304.1 HK97 family phage prohead protease [Mesorhizobium sp. INR15]
MVSELEIRTKPLDIPQGTTVSGHAAIFHSEAVIAGEFRERIAPGAFSQSIKSQDVLALLHHDSSRILGRTSSGTLVLREDAKGLFFSLDADPTTPDGATLLGLVGRGDIKGMSFGFRVLEENWEDTGGLPLRTLKRIDLIEISAVGTPAYDDTTIGLRSLATYRASATRLRLKLALEQKLRGIG